jgi:hypothetical protein
MVLGESYSTKTEKTAEMPLFMKAGLLMDFPKDLAGKSNRMAAFTMDSSDLALKMVMGLESFRKMTARMSMKKSSRSRGATLRSEFITNLTEIL